MNKNRNEAAEEVENFYCFFNIIEPGVLYYTFYDEKILFYPHLFLQFSQWTPGKWNLSICSLTSFDNITTTAFHCGQGECADCWTFYTINL